MRSNATVRLSETPSRHTLPHPLHRRHPALGSHLHAPLSLATHEALEQVCHGACALTTSGSNRHAGQGCGASHHMLKHLRHHPLVGIIRHSPLRERAPFAPCTSCSPTSTTSAASSAVGMVSPPQTRRPLGRAGAWRTAQTARPRPQAASTMPSPPPLLINAYRETAMISASLAALGARTRAAWAST